jgi:putative ATP-binding cassette transporter
MSSSVTARAASSFTQVLKRVFALAAPYFRSEEKWRASAMFADHRRAQPGLRLRAGAFQPVVRALLRRAAEQGRRPCSGARFACSACSPSSTSLLQVLKFYVTQLLQLRWRTWMTRNYMTRWMSDRTFYHLELARYAGSDGQAPDNPDQRIQEDMQMFTDYTMTLSMGLLNAVVTLVSFIGMLWVLSGSFAFTMGGTTYQVVGAMVWVALAYCVVGTVITHFIGRPLIKHQLHASSASKPTSGTTWCACANTARRSRWTGARRWSTASSTCASADVLRNYLLLIKQQKNLDHLHLVLRSGRGDLPVRGRRASSFFSGAIQLGQLDADLARPSARCRSR